MATVVVQHHQPQLRQATPPPLTPTLTLNTPRSSTPVPNKHLPFCPPGPIPSPSEITPPSSPPSRQKSLKATSLLYPPNGYQKLLNSPPIYGLDAKSLADALTHFAAQPLPSPAQVFPWLHGLHPDNHIQLAFFVGRKRSVRRVPRCLRGITLIKAGGDLSRARIRGAVAPDEVFNLCDDSGKGFLDCDPKDGFSVRNFHIQTTKMAQVSDIVVYGDEKTDHRIIKSVAERAAAVQRQWRKEVEASGQTPESYNTFVLTDPFEDFEQAYPGLAAVDSQGQPTGEVLDFLQQERKEMCAMSKASEISKGVFQGPTPDPNTIPTSVLDEHHFDLFIEASDHATMPDEKLLRLKQKQFEEVDGDVSVHIPFPSSGSILPPSWSSSEVDGLLLMCRWLYNLTHNPRRRKSDSMVQDEDGDIQMSEFSGVPRRVLIHCADGYTETSLLAVAYFMYAEGLPVHDAWIKLHREKGRNFFAYPSDVALLTSLQERLLKESPALDSSRTIVPKAPAWLAKLDGSLPSRILPYMYLGNLTHANNPEMLKLLGITRILSVGEPVSWPASALEEWGRENLMMVDRVQDNGIDELSLEMTRCLEFIGKFASWWVSACTE
jgi:dual specificity MAP kinase phosphatase